MRKKILLSLALASLLPISQAAAHHIPQHVVSNDQTTFRLCDASACFVYQNFGTPEDPNWVLVSIEPIIRGERNVD
ncbi:hypothetical protein [Erythrobacter sp. CCH5-A1]|jgi:hypothetical protein|uniref:hypothetical protein n=1 Tax=Erythrobacter sp. CCH5-A1 TaxID=1768792 RepID=UPI000836AC01|nr:hypothetical protein [Erythrobacter sp. CCH5-A1]